MVVDAVVTRDFAGARALLAPDVEFRSMTPSRFWEADEPEGVEAALRAWLDDPGREVDRIEPTQPGAVQDTVRMGWRVSGTRAEGAFVFEQQAFARERDGRIVWLRVMCSGPRDA